MQSFLDRTGRSAADASRHRLFISEPWRSTLPSVQKGFSPEFLEKLHKSHAGDYLAETRPTAAGVCVHASQAGGTRRTAARPSPRAIRGFKETMLSEVFAT